VGCQVGDEAVVDVVPGLREAGARGVLFAYELGADRTGVSLGTVGGLLVLILWSVACQWDIGSDCEGREMID
jgi:hypothetical protein